MKRPVLILVAVVCIVTFSTAGFCNEGDISFSGFLSADLNISSTDFADGTDESESDIFVYEFGLAVSAGLAENVSVDALFLFEEEEDDADVYDTIDEAYLTYKTDMIYGKFGKLYIPFADAGTNFLDDSFTVNLGEARESVIMAGIDIAMLNIEVGTFNGDSNEIKSGAVSNEEEEVEDVFAAIKITPVEDDSMEIVIGAAYISDITDTDAELLGDDTGYVDVVAGYSAFITATAKTGAIIVEYVAAADDIDTKVFNDGGTPDDTSDDTLTDETLRKPSALNIEVVTTFVEDFLFGLKYETSKGVTAIVNDTNDANVDRVGAIIAYSLNENATVTVEYLTDEDDADNSTDSITARLGLEF